MFQSIYTNPGYDAATASTLKSSQSAVVPPIQAIVLPSVLTPAAYTVPPPTYVSPVVVPQVLLSTTNTVQNNITLNAPLVNNPVFINPEPPNQINYLNPTGSLITPLASGGGVMSDRFSTLFTSSFQASTILMNSDAWISTPLLNVSSINYSSRNVFLGVSAGQNPPLNALSTNSCNIGIGYQAGFQSQQPLAIALGAGAGVSYQDTEAIAIGHAAGSSYQNVGAIAIGANAGISAQGSNSIAIGYNTAPSIQSNASIFINATGDIYNNPLPSSFCVAPIRNQPHGNYSTLVYDATTKEILYTDFTQTTSNVIYTSSIFCSTLTATSVYASNIITSNIDTKVITTSSIVYTSTDVKLGVNAGASPIPGNIGNVAIGINAGGTAKGFGTYVGAYSGVIGGQQTVSAFGAFSANCNAGSNVCAFGYEAGQNYAGANSVFIGAYAGLNFSGLNTSTATSSITINATGAELNPIHDASLTVAPIRSLGFSSNLSTLHYDPTTCEIVYTDSSEYINPPQIFTSSIVCSTITSAGFISAGGNITGANLTTGGNVAASGSVDSATVRASYFVSTSEMVCVDTKASGVVYTPSLNVQGAGTFGYNTSYINGNLQFGTPGAALFPDFIAYPAACYIGSIASPCTSFQVAALGQISLRTATFLNLTGAGAVSVSALGGITMGAGLAISFAASGAISFLSGGVITFGTGGAITFGTLGVVTIAGGIINLAAGTINMIGGTINAGTFAFNIVAGAINMGAIAINMLGGVINLGGGVVNMGAAQFNIATGNTLAVFGDVNFHNKVALWDGISTTTITNFDSAGLLLNDTTSQMQLVGLSTINGAPYGGGGAAISSFTELFTSSFTASSITGSLTHPIITNYTAQLRSASSIDAGSLIDLGYSGSALQVNNAAAISLNTSGVVQIGDGGSSYFAPSSILAVDDIRDRANRSYISPSTLNVSSLINVSSINGAAYPAELVSSFTELFTSSFTASSITGSLINPVVMGYTAQIGSAANATSGSIIDLGYSGSALQLNNSAGLSFNTAGIVQIGQGGGSYFTPSSIMAVDNIMDRNFRVYITPSTLNVSSLSNVSSVNGVSWPPTVATFSTFTNLYTSSLAASSITTRIIDVSTMTMGNINLSGSSVDIGGGYSANGGRVAIGFGAGSNAGGFIQGSNSIAIGNASGYTQVGSNAVAIGWTSGYNQSSNCVAIGTFAGANQGCNATAIGFYAQASGAGSNAVAIGNLAGYTNGFTAQTANSIVINANNVGLGDSGFGSLTIKPIRQAQGISTLSYNPTSGEITYNDGTNFSSIYVSSISSMFINNSSTLKSAFANVSSLYVSSISSVYGSFSSINTDRFSSIVGNISSLYASTISSVNGNFSSINTERFSSIVGNISTFYASSISSFATTSSNARFSTINTSSIVTFSTLTTVLQTSTINVSTFNGGTTNNAPLPKFWISSSGLIATTIATGGFANVISMTNISSLGACKFQINGSLAFGSTGAANDTIFMTVYQNGAQVSLLSTCTTNTGANHIQQLTISDGGSFGANSSTNTLAIYARASAGTYTLCNASMNIITNLI